MTFDLREARGRAVDMYQPFEFLGDDGETYQIPHAKMIPPAVVASMESDDPDVRSQGLKDLAAEAWAILEELEPGLLMMVMEAWREHSGIGGDDEDEVGKEPAPSSAPNRAARRSKPTSRSGASTSTKPRSGKSKAASGPS